MKKALLFLSLALFGSGVQAQIGADAVQSEAASPLGKTVQNSPVYVQNRAVGVTSSALPCGGGIDTLVASGVCSYIWSTDSLGLNIVSTSDSLITGSLTNDTTLYVTGFEATAETLAAMPAQASTFTGNVRGYYFVAPMDMFITGLYIPQTAGTGTQNVAILLFDNQTPPPVYSATTEAFTNLGTWTNFPANDTIFTCFAIDSGDVIGIYGQRATVNSYGNGSSGIVIGGTPVPIVRSGMQFSLTTTPMQQVWSEPSSTNISRVEFFYDITPTTETVPVFINVPQPSSSMNSATICEGDSILIGNTYQYTAGQYVETLFNVDGCDSVATTDLTVNPLPTVSITSDTTCLQSAPFSLNGTPNGGTFSGSGVSGGNFDPAVAGVGSIAITYTYTDQLGCTNSANGTIVVENCASIGDLNLQGIQVYPNPVKDEIRIDLPAIYTEANVKLYDASGKLLISEKIQSGLAILNTSSLSEGMYLVEVSVNEKSNAYKLVKK